MSRESEFLSRHEDDLTHAAEFCRRLQKQAVETSPRTQIYLEIMKICKRLEGACRQMAHERGDDPTWLDIGMHYHKMGEQVRVLRNKHKWLLFGKLAEVFEAGIPRVRRLATMANGLTSLNTGTLDLPRFLQTRVSPGGIILP